MSRADGDSGAESSDEVRRIHVGETADGDPVELPVVEVLTGRGFITGKSGSGKSNTASVVVEELLEASYPVCIIDTDGEYYGLKESYELLHAGADEECDVQVSPEHAEKLANLALEQNVPLILDVSGFLDQDDADDLIRETARHLFAKEKKLKKPFLLVVEECHEYIPEGGGMDETGRMFVQIGKRGRKHGLGIVGISQRPADVKKDFITQANWLCWHRLTWENDTKVVGRIVGSDYGDRVSDLDNGQAFVQSDWTETDVQTIQFKRKRTFDAGATPGLDDFERPELKSVSDALTEDLSEITEQQQREQDRIEELEQKLANREERIAELERELENARDVSAAARKMANALQHGDAQASYQAKLADANGDDAGAAQSPELAELRQRVDELEATLDAIDAMAADADDAAGDADGEDVADAAERTREVSDLVVDAFEERLKKRGEQLAEAERDAAGSDADAADASAATDASSGDEPGSDTGFEPAVREDAGTGTVSEDGTPTVQDASTAAEIIEDEDPDPEFELPPLPDDFADLLAEPPVKDRLAGAVADSLCNREYGKRVLAAIAEEPRTAQDLAEATHASVEKVHSLLSELRARELVARDADREYAYRPARLRVLADEDPHEGGELGDQWRP